jgi:imidazolonepropionase-like amidohydrolase
MQGWHAGGVPLSTIFEAATLRNAEVFGLADEVGRIAPGMHADLLLLVANPLETLEAYDQIETVILDGQPINRDKLSASQP